MPSNLARVRWVLQRMISRNSANQIARGVLVVLVFIYLILPFSFSQNGTELPAKAGSVLFGFSFLGSVALSYPFPRAAFRYGLILLLALYVFLAATGSTPVSQGILPKFIFAGGLILGVQANQRNDP